ncbi:hypothetical protein NQD34_008558 [Periophthalmus magnuspinnatus]|nr:hypothetical protein NQD34_008558 [Periophthalmus magnuspinnatus]
MAIFIPKMKRTERVDSCLSFSLVCSDDVCDVVDVTVDIVVVVVLAVVVVFVYFLDLTLTAGPVSPPPPPPHTNKGSVQMPHSSRDDVCSRPLKILWGENEIENYSIWLALLWWPSI